MRLKYALLVIAFGAVVAGSIGLGHEARAAAGRPAAAALTDVSAAATQSAAADERTGEVIVKFRRSATLGDVGEALADAESEATASSAGSGLVLLDPEPGQTDDAAIASLRARGDVEFAEPNHVVHIVATPTDPLYVSNQWSLPQIGLPTAWNTSTGSASVIVAVIDTGVDSAHPDLSGKMTTGANAGYNFVGGNTTTTDDHFHGTFVASIIAANTNNGAGGAGVCWACKIMPIKVLDNTGSGSTFNVAQGVDWAVAHGAQVINMSLGSAASDATLLTAVNNAWAAGVIVVAASGNNNGPVLYPASYANAIAVGSNNQAGAKSSFSNFGAELDIMAPGESVLGALCTCASYAGGYGTGSGTSFAAPHLAGVVGLLISAGITNKDTIRTKLQTTATDMDAAGFDNNTGWGRVNAAAAISTAAPYSISWGANTLPTTVPPNGTTGVTATFTNTGSSTWTAGGANPVRFAYHWRNGACSGTSSAIFNGVRTALPGDIAPGATVTSLSATIASPASAGTYCLQYDLVKEGVTWFSSQGATMQSATVTVTAPAYAVSWGANTLPTTVAPNGTTGVTATFTNTGSSTWTAGGANPVHFAYHWRNGACSGTSSAIFNGVRTALPGDVAPGATVASLSATIASPASAGTYCLQYDLVKEGVTWFSSQGATMQSATVTVTAPAYGVSWGANTTPGSMPASAATPVTISFSNTGSLTWSATGANPVRLAYHWKNGACPGSTTAVFDGNRTQLPADVATGGSVTNVAATITAPPSAGTYCLVYDLVREGITWFSWQGAATLAVTVSVT